MSAGHYWIKNLSTGDAFYDVIFLQLLKMDLFALVLKFNFSFLKLKSTSKLTRTAARPFLSFYGKKWLGFYSFQLECLSIIGYPNPTLASYQMSPHSSGTCMYTAGLREAQHNYNSTKWSKIQGKNYQVKNFHRSLPLASFYIYVITLRVIKENVKAHLVDFVAFYRKRKSCAHGLQKIAV